MRLALVTLHRWLGLFSAVFLALAGLTGAIIAWDHELDAWLNPELFKSPHPNAAPLSALELANRLEASDPRLRVSYLALGQLPGHTQLLSVTPRDDPATGKPHELDFDQVFVDPSSGDVLGTRKWGEVSLAPKNLLPFLYRLHYTLHLPEGFGVELGTLLMGIVAIVWFLDGFVALSISFPSWNTWRKSFAFRFGAGGYRLIFDLHRSTGVWLWLLLTVFALSAVDMNLGEQVLQPVVGVFSKLTPHPYFERIEQGPRKGGPEATRAQVIARAREEIARLKLEAPVGALYHSTEAGLYGVGLFQPGNDHGDGGLGNPWLYLDAANGAYLGADLPGHGSAGDLFMQFQFPIHSGRIAGVAGRVAVSVLGILITMLSVTGIVIWARKRRARLGAAQKRARGTPAATEADE